MMLKILLISAFTVFLLKEVTSKGRFKKWKYLRVQNYPQQYNIYESDWLPSDVQITTYLYKNTPKTFFYWSPADRKSLSIIIMACSSTVEWAMFYKENVNISRTENNSLENYNESTKDTSINHFTSLKGTYILNVISKENNTYAHVYISTENGGPQALRSAMQNSLKIVNKEKKGWLTVKWEPSLVDPQRTDYCLVISKEKHYKTMCSAELEVFHKNQPAWEFKSGLANSLEDSYPLIQCVGRKTSLKVPNIKNKMFYYFDLFAINKQSNLTYLLDWAYKKFDSGSKFIPIRDEKVATLRKMEGKAVFRFKVGRKSGKSLNLCIIPCGSYVYVDIRLQEQVIVPQTKVERFQNITIPNIAHGQRYLIGIVPPREEFDNTGIEIFATTKSSIRSPIPMMPHNTTVKEYESLKTCNSVTLGWMPSQGKKSATYCFIVKEGKIKENEGYSQPNQCGLENRLRKSLDFAAFAFKFCKHLDHRNQSVITKEIKRLKPGRSYVVLVSVKNPKGRSLSYNLLQVNTLNYCNNYNRIIE